MLFYSAVHHLTHKHHDSINCAAFSNNGSLLASGDDNGVLRIHNTESALGYEGIWQSTCAVTALVWHPSDKGLFVGLSGCRVDFIPLDGGTQYEIPLYTFPHLNAVGDEHNPLAQVTSLAVDEEHGLLAVGVGDSAIVVTRPKGQKGPLSFSPECDPPPTMISFNLGQDDDSDPDLEEPPSKVQSVHFMRQGADIFLVVTYLQDGIRCFNTKTHEQAWMIEPKSAGIGRSAIDSQGRYLVCSNLVDGFDVYNLSQRTYIGTIPLDIPEDRNVPLPAKFIHKDSYVLLGSACGEVAIASIPECQVVRTLPHGTDIIQAIDHTTIGSAHYIVTGAAEKGEETDMMVWLSHPEILFEPDTPDTPETPEGHATISEVNGRTKRARSSDTLREEDDWGVYESDQERVAKKRRNTRFSSGREGDESEGTRRVKKRRRLLQVQESPMPASDTDSTSEPSLEVRTRTSGIRRGKRLRKRDKGKKGKSALNILSLHNG
ncbi:hypothetical protein CC2G_002287 [Coprinopsis cinerea AmutBmut pab1-1]|nr:hypothetical protein CC2G_002287 [Coprinopsis cinerea AmutBmut pab1-1]